MAITMIPVILCLVFCLAAAGVGIYLLILIIRALRKYIGSKEEKTK